MSARLAAGATPATLDFGTLQALRTRPGNGNPAIWWVDAGFLESMREKALKDRP